MNREAIVERKTKETEISIRLNIDGTGKYKIETGIGFFNHMLELFSKHSMMDLEAAVKGDLEVDCHHTVEDTGIALGQAFKQALLDKRSIKRYASVTLPMDEALVGVNIDISGRPYLVFNGEFLKSSIGNMDTEAVLEFLTAFTVNAGITLHVNILYGKNTHHIIEAIFKALARGLREAVSFDDKETGIPSTKGVL